jgi:hypothetical protein
MIFDHYVESYCLSMRFAVAVLLMCAFTVHGQVAEKKSVPKFDDYPVAETWQGTAASVQLTSRSEHLFRTQLREAARKPPDFAGHYRFAIWGCGTQCVGGALIDLGAGKVFQPPLAPKKAGEEHWIFCTDWDKTRGAEYRLDSRLFILHCGEEVYYFIWENSTFREIAHSRAGKPE